MKPVQKQALQASGLPSREADVWFALQERGASHVSQIAQAITLHRPAVYGCLEALLAKGLVREVMVGDRKHYETTGIKKLEAWKWAQDGAFASYVKTAKVKSTETQSDAVRIFKGEALKEVWSYIAKHISKKALLYRYDGYPAKTYIDKLVPADYYPQLEEKKVERFVITNEALRKRVFKKKIDCASRMLPAMVDAFEPGITQFVFDDTLVFVDLVAEKATVLISAPLAAYHKQLFRFVYQTLKV